MIVYVIICIFLELLLYMKCAISKKFALPVSESDRQ